MPEVQVRLAALRAVRAASAESIAEIFWDAASVFAEGDQIADSVILSTTALLLLAERDRVPFGITDCRDPFSPRHVLCLAKDFDPELPKLPDQSVEVAYVHIRRPTYPGSPSGGSW